MILLALFLIFALVSEGFGDVLCLKDQTVYDDWETCQKYCEDVWCVEEGTYVCTPPDSPNSLPDPGEITLCLKQTTCPLDYSLPCVPGIFEQQCRQEVDPICDCGYEFDPTLDLCVKEETVSCPSGYSYNESLSEKYGVKVCISPNFYCKFGHYDPLDRRCEVTSVDQSCPEGYSLDSEQNVCYGPPTCPGEGNFYPPEELCYVLAEINCTPCTNPNPNVEYIFVNYSPFVDLKEPSFDAGLDKCVYAPFCPNPQTKLPFVCPSTQVDFGQKTYYNGASNKCAHIVECIPYWQCPLNPDYGCVDAGSPQCFIQDAVDETYLQDDAPYDDSGNCLGQLYFLNGRPMKCRPPGYETGFHDCCDADDKVVKDFKADLGKLTGTLAVAKYSLKIKDAFKLAGDAIKAYRILSDPDPIPASQLTGLNPVSVSAAQQALANGLSETDAAMRAIQNGLGLTPANIATMVAIHLATQLLFRNCSADDQITAIYKEAGLCHYIGKKCVKKLPVIGCVQKAKVYCCFNSKLARVIHEQGRAQLKGFPGGSWGSPKKPNCRGFTPEEFQMLDFGKMDLSEGIEDTDLPLQEEIRQNVEQQINKFQQSISD